MLRDLWAVVPNIGMQCGAVGVLVCGCFGVWSV